MSLKKRCFPLFPALLAAAVSTATPPVSAASCTSGPGWFQSGCNRLHQVWDEGRTEMYVSGYAWHNRWTYTREKVDTFREVAWGGGLGKGFHDEDGDWHGLYAMAFLDSHSDWQPIAGYAFQKIGRIGENGRVGAGYTVFLTSRSDMFGRAPFPGALPLVSVGYRKADLYATYIPGASGAGNVLFMFGKVAF
ncbi:Lipid A acylation protein PagP, palmitoyltransferase [plant metagenome]|uniref:Lipid A acylation protein PagP, palmitoyltransferase n=1 Tax=plant metagenome TaxID=1297885 RepID=A0A484TW12_9ZZZZ